MTELTRTLNRFLLELAVAALTLAAVMVALLWIPWLKSRGVHATIMFILTSIITELLGSFLSFSSPEKKALRFTGTALR
jgi:hypothetical protein